MDEDQDEALDMVPEATQRTRGISPSISGLRHRPLGRATTFAESTQPFVRRSSSFMSETLSESRRSLKSTTDDLFHPRVSHDEDIHGESSNWHSLPLLLALLPAVGGLFFQNGSAFITDISLLGLAALFLNWAVRLPWDWYRSAQAMTTEVEDEIESQALDSAIDEETSEVGSTSNLTPSKERHSTPAKGNRAQSAAAELRIHELLALSACFIFPILGAWLLHAIRSQLSRPSEGLVSDYNLTIFLLASEVRPLSHLVKLIQRRTLFLQRTITASATNKKNEIPEQSQIIEDLNQRLIDLEAHIAGSVLLPTASQPPSPPNEQNNNGPISVKNPKASSQPTSLDDIVAYASSQASTELRRTFQPDLDALNRAMRRYEKRLTVSAIQVETRLQDLEVKIQDVVILAAAVQRNVDKQYGRYTPILLNWLSMGVVVPVQWTVWTLGTPVRIANKVVERVKSRLGLKTKSSTNPKNGRNGKPVNSVRPPKPRDKKAKDSM